MYAVKLTALIFIDGKCIFNKLFYQLCVWVMTSQGNGMEQVLKLNVTLIHLSTGVQSGNGEGHSYTML